MFSKLLVSGGSYSLIQNSVHVIRVFSTESLSRIFYSPAQAIQCVINTAHTPAKKHCILSLRLNESLPKSSLQLEGEMKLPYNNDDKRNLVVVSDTIKTNSLESFGVTLLSTERLINLVENDQIVTDAILCTPDTIAKLAPIAPILGPKRLMPSKKLGTLAENIEEAVKIFSQPVIHYENNRNMLQVVLGRLEQPSQELVANFKAFYDEMCKQRSKCIQSLFRSVYVNCENGTQYYVNNKFLLPGKHYFNESYADKNIVIPAKRAKAKKMSEKVVNQLFDDTSSTENNDSKPIEIENEIDDKW